MRIPLHMATISTWAFLSATAVVVAEAPSRFGDVTDARMLNAGKEPQNWLVHGGDLQEHRYSGLTQINVQTVSRLGPAWSFEFDTTRAQESTPIVVDGMMYVTTAASKVYALDAQSGKQIWFYDPKVPGEQLYKPCCDIPNRGAAVYKGKVYVGTIDGRLVALDARTGREVWSVITVDQTKMYSITSAPRIAKGKIVIGNSGADMASVRGYVTAYEAETGKQAWRFYIVPGDPAKGPDHAASDSVMESLVRPTWFGDKYWIYGGGGNAWGGMTYDAELNQLYIGTGNGLPTNRTLRSAGKGDNLFLASILALDPDTGRYLWHYQENPGESWDYDATQPIILTDLKIAGGVRKVLMQTPKNGFFYVIDRTNGKLISAEPFVPVKWATRVDLKTGRPVEVAGVRYETAPFAVNSAAHNWHPFALSPKTGLVYFQAQENLAQVEQPDSIEFHEGLENPGVKWPPSLPPPPAPGTVPRPSSYLLAWDPVAQKPRWKVDEPGAGVLATGGDLVFQGRDRGGVMGELVAYDARNGRKLWSHKTPNAIMPGPISYSVNGVQYVAVVSGANLIGGRGVPRASQPGRVVVFKLDGNADLPADPAVLPPPQLPTETWAASQVEEGSKLYMHLCWRCHLGPEGSLNVIPDLRRSPFLANRVAWQGVVIEGVLAPRGMISWKKFLTPDQAESIRGYVADRAKKDAKDAKDARPGTASPANEVPSGAVDAHHQGT